MTSVFITRTMMTTTTMMRIQFVEEGKNKRSNSNRISYCPRPDEKLTLESCMQQSLVPALYPAGLQHLEWDGTRARILKEAMEDGTVGKLLMDFSHDNESMMAVLSLYRPTDIMRQNELDDTILLKDANINYSDEYMESISAKLNNVIGDMELELQTKSYHYLFYGNRRNS